MKTILAPVWRAGVHIKHSITIAPMRYGFIRNFILVLAAAFSFRNTYAQATDQNYPVTAQAFIASQPNARLSSYFSSNTALMVNLLLKDLTKSSIQVYLKWSLDGPGVRVASQNGYIPAGLITLDRGIIARFSGAQLQNDYFLASAIEEQGLGGNAVRTSLPEGFYTFRVQALEAGTGRQVSNIAETYLSITTPLPPVINLPFNGAELVSSQPQTGGAPPVNIQWMPRHYRLPGHITSYDLKVCKVPDGYEPTEAIEACASPVIDDKGNPGTFYPGNTGIGNSIIGALEQGARYAARVTVHEIDADGNQVIFANQGQSEVTWFRYGKPCTSPETFTVNGSGPGRVQLGWAAQPGVDSYNVLYRKAGEAKWHTQAATGTGAPVAGLDAGSYEFALQSGCSSAVPQNVQGFNLTNGQIDGQATPGAIAGITHVNGLSVDSLSALLDSIPMPCPGQISAFESCAAGHPVINPAGTIPLNTLAKGDVLAVYDMVVVVTESNGSSPFSGKGLVRLPYLSNVLTPVEFDNIQAWKSQEGTRGGCVSRVDGYFRTYSISGPEIPAGADSAGTGILKDSIRYVVVNPIGSNAATISWRGGQAFTRYVIKYQLSSGAELQQETSSPSVTLTGLRDASRYGFTIQAYDAAGGLLDSYGPGNFSTAFDRILTPQNVAQAWQGTSGVLTWDFDPEHTSYKLVYKDKDGLEKTVYPATNKAILPDLDPRLSYPFTLVALGKTQTGASVESEPATGVFQGRANREASDGNGDGTGPNADDFEDGRDLEEVVIKNQQEAPFNFYKVFGGLFEEPAIDNQTTLVDIQAVNPANPMKRPWKKIESYSRFKQLKCPGESDLVAAHKYKVYVVAQLFGNLAHVVESTGEVVADATSSLAMGVAGFIGNLFGEVQERHEADPALSYDDLFNSVFYRLTIAQYPFSPDDQGNYPPVKSCNPAPSWTAQLRECDLLAIKNDGSKSGLPILFVDSDGKPVQIVEALESANGDYYYNDGAKAIEYWKLEGTYLVARIKGKDWVYWNIYVGKWCGFTPASMRLVLDESENACQDASGPSLNGAIKVRVLNGQGPYEYRAGPGGSVTSELPTFTVSDIGGTIVDIQVKDSKGCTAQLSGQYVQTIPSSSMDVSIKLRNCNNAVVLQPICGTPPFQYSMDGKKYQSSNEFAGIQQMIGPAGENTNGMTRAFTFYVKDARGVTASKNIVLKRNDYVTMGVRDVGNQKYPGYKDQIFTNGSTGGFKDLRHVNKSSGVLVTHTEKFCEEIKGSIRLDSKATDNSASPYTYRLTGPDGATVSVTKELPGHTFEGLEPGHYRIEGEDGNGCPVESFHSRKGWSDGDTQDVDIVDAGLSVQVTTVPPVCGDGTGSIQITAKGGAFKRDLASNPVSVGAYYVPGQYLSVDDEYIDNLNKDNKDLRADIDFPQNTYWLYKPVGSYDIKVSDYLGCSVKQTVKLTAPARLVIEARVSPSTEATSPSVLLEVTGGTRPYRELIMRGPGFKEQPVEEGLVTGLRPGTYFAEVIDSKGCRGFLQFEIPEPQEITSCNPAPAPLVESELKETPGGRLAATDLPGVFVAPNGRLVRLPPGAMPITFIFTEHYAQPPAGTLQGFRLSDGSLYYAEIFGGNREFHGYRLANSKPCQYLKDIYVAAAPKAYFIERFSGDGTCGFRVIEAENKVIPTGSRQVIDPLPPISGETVITYDFKVCTTETGWVTGNDGTKRRTIMHAGSTFYLEESKGNITVKGEWKSFSKCPDCNDTAEKALQQALSKARSANGGKLTEKTVVIEKVDLKYGTIGLVSYMEMDLAGIIKNLAETYNSLLENARVPEAVWQPGKQFYVRDETAVISGAIDQGIEEATDLPQLVGLGLTLVSDPKGAYDQLKSFWQHKSWDKVWDFGEGFVKGLVFYDEFEKGGQYARHAIGRAGVVIGKTVLGGVILTVVKNAPEALAKKLDNIAALLARLKTKLKDPGLASVLEKDLGSQELFDALDADPDLVNGWEVLHNAGRADLKLSKVALQKVRELLNDAKVQKALGENYTEQLALICKSQGGFKGANSLVKHLDDVKTFCTKFEGKDGFDQVIASMKNSNDNVQDGLQHVLTQVNKADFDAGKVSKFDMEFEGEGLPCTKCKFDVERIPTADNPLRLIEYKSYLDASKIQLPQFLNYIASVDDLIEMKYIFNAAKLSSEQARDGMRTFVKANKVSIFGAIKPDLRESLEIKSAINLTDEKISEMVNKFVESK